MNHRPRKRFGQNFLQSQPVIAHILAVFNPKRHDRVVEIGPGLGALTKPLLAKLNHLIAIEIDNDLHDYLNQLVQVGENLELVAQDALTVDFAQWGDSLRIIGNLPYNISTPLLLHLIKYGTVIKDMHFMLQKEVVERVVSKPGCKNYGRLSIIIQYFCEASFLFEVPPTAFHPKPKVDSAILRLVPHRTMPYPTVNIKRFEKLIAQAFSMRRKTLANNLKPLLSANQLLDLQIEPSLRPEQLSIHEYVRLARALENGVE